MSGPGRGTASPGSDGSSDGSGSETGSHTGSGTGNGATGPIGGPSDPIGGVDGRGEGPLRRADRNMIELLQELRVAQTGVQILFAFLLSLSFTQRFGSIDDFQRWTYVVTLLCSAVTAGLLVAPAAAHRVTFRRGVKAETVQLGHRLFTLGLASLMVTLTGAVLLVLDVAVGRDFAIAAAAAVAAVLGSLWFLLPIPLVRRAGAAPDGGAGPPLGEKRTTTGGTAPR